MDPLTQVRLSSLMERGFGRPEISIALIDGPVLLTHSQFSSSTVREVTSTVKGACSRSDTIACTHGTFIAGILCARRGSAAPAICPGCTLLLRPIFLDTIHGTEETPSASPQQLAESITDSVNAGARLINISAALIQSSPAAEVRLQDALDYAGHNRAIVIAAAGNQGKVASSIITRHPAVIPVVACNREGQPLSQTNLGASIGRKGLSAPGENITSLGTDGDWKSSSGTSAATPFVTGSLALLWSEFPNARSAELRIAIAGNHHRRNSIVPPLLDAWAAFQAMASIQKSKAR